MAGTLITQNIQGPSSGANANKILIPSGQTLDVSSGTLTPSAGAVVQVQYRVNVNQNFTSSSTSMTDVTGFYVDITPKFSNSILVWQTSFTVNNTATASYERYRIVDSLNSSTKWNSNSYMGSSSYYAGTSQFIETPLLHTNTAGTTNAMRLQLQVVVDAGGTMSIGWSNADNRTIMVTEIKQ